MTDVHEQISQMIFDTSRNYVGECGRVAVIGPRRSGKTDILNRVSAALGSQASSRLLQVRLDLAVERFSDFDDPARQLASAIRQSDKLRELQRNYVLSLPQGGTLADTLEMLLLKLPGKHLLLEIDHLEAAPLYAARALAEQLHPLLDVGISKESAAAERLGLLVCGSISLHSLLDIQNSGFNHCKPIHALSFSPDVRSAAVKRILESYTQPVDEQVVSALALWTGGEPAFAYPLLDQLKGKKLTPAAVKKVARQNCGLGTSLQVLRELAMEVHRNPQLRGLVTSALTNKKSPVAPLLGSPSEITEVELSGVFVVYQERFEFRNEMVKEFMQQMFSESTRLSPWLSSIDVRSLSNGVDDVMQMPQCVEVMARTINVETSIWPIIPKLTELWRALIPAFTEPIVAVLAYVEGQWYRLDDDGQKVVPLLEADTDFVFHAARGSQRAAERAERKPITAQSTAFFNGDDGRLAIGVPIGPPKRMIAVVTTVHRTLRGAAWSEPSLRNWIWFVRHDAGSNLLVRGTLEVFRYLHAANHGQPKCKETLLSTLGAIERFRSEVIVHDRLERFGKRFHRWGTVVLSGSGTEEVLEWLREPTNREEWMDICQSEFADFKREVAKLTTSPNAASVVHDIQRIVTAVDNVTEALANLEIRSFIESTQTLHNHILETIGRAGDLPSRLEQIITKASHFVANPD